MTKGVLNSLKLDKWYKVFVYIGFLLFFISLFFSIKGISNGELQLLSGGIFFIGIGEWISWKVGIEYTYGPGMLTYPLRKHTFLGWFFIIVGILLVILFILSIIKGKLPPHQL
jgi:hypothetical protein